MAQDDILGIKWNFQYESVFSMIQGLTNEDKDPFIIIVYSTKVTNKYKLFYRPLAPTEGKNHKYEYKSTNEQINKSIIQSLVHPVHIQNQYHR